MQKILNYLIPVHDKRAINSFERKYVPRGRLSQYLFQTAERLQISPTVGSLQKPPASPKSRPKVQQKYIPGLNERPMDFPVEEAPRKIPQSLIDGFLNGSKNPVSAVMEYAAMMNLYVEFQETAVEKVPGTASMNFQFASVCTLDGRLYPQGVGRTKKDAKIAAGKVAFNAVVGLQEAGT